MKMGLLADNTKYFRHQQGVPFSAQQKTGFMGGFYPSHKIGYPPGHYTSAMNHAKQGFSLPPLDGYTNQQGDRVVFSGAKEGWHPRY